MGAVLTAINADTVLLVGGAGTGLLANVDTTSEGTYTLRACGVTSTAPNAVNDSATTPQGAAITINVLSNDTHPQNQALTLVSATDPPHGTAVANTANGTVTYTPDAAYSGTDSFSYTVRDPDGETDTANVLVTDRAALPDRDVHGRPRAWRRARLDATQTASQREPGEHDVGRPQRPDHGEPDEPLVVQ